MQGIFLYKVPCIFFYPLVCIWNIHKLRSATLTPTKPGRLYLTDEVYILHDKRTKYALSISD